MGQLTSRQEIINGEVSDPRMRNWLCANIALRETSNALAISLHQKMSRIHKQMKQSVGASPLCHQNCSYLKENTDQWCALCKRWKQEILSVCVQHYMPLIKWSRLNSSQWPRNPYEVGRAFIPRAHRLYYKSAEFHEDCRFTLSFIENCAEVSVPKSLCEKAWQCRGKLKRKNSCMRMSRQELEETITVLIELLLHPVFGDHEKVVNKLQSLLDIPEDGSDGCVVM